MLDDVVCFLRTLFKQMILDRLFFACLSHCTLVGSHLLSGTSNFNIPMTNGLTDQGSRFRLKVVKFLDCTGKGAIKPTTNTHEMTFEQSFGLDTMESVFECCT